MLLINLKIIHIVNESQLAKLKKSISLKYYHEMLVIGGFRWSIICQLCLQKIKVFVNTRNLGQFLEIKWYFANKSLIKVWIWGFVFTHVTHIIVIIFHTANFVSRNKFLVPDFLSQFCVFSEKSPYNVIQRSVTKENPSKRAKTRHPF